VTASDERLYAVCLVMASDERLYALCLVMASDERLYAVCLVMASDGLWDTHTNEEVVDRVRRSIRHR
jgi:hypothetical protein